MSLSLSRGHRTAHACESAMFQVMCSLICDVQHGNVHHTESENETESAREGGRGRTLARTTERQKQNKKNRWGGVGDGPHDDFLGEQRHHLIFLLCHVGVLCGQERVWSSRNVSQSALRYPHFVRGCENNSLLLRLWAPSLHTGKRLWFGLSSPKEVVTVAAELASRGRGPPIK